MKKMFPLLVLVLLSLTMASGQIRYDTVFSRRVGPGMVHTKLIAPSGPWEINVLTADLKNPYIKIESRKSNDRLGSGLERTSAMSKRIDAPGHYVVGAVNADFFSFDTGDPTNSGVVNGEIVQKISSSNPTVAATPANGIRFGAQSISGFVIARGVKITTSTFNAARVDNQLASYNGYYGSSTGTAAPCTEVRIRPVGDWYANDTMRCVVEAVLTTGNSAIEKGKAILSGNGTAAAFLSANCVAGDTLKYYTKVFTSLGKITSLVGGHPMLVQKDTMAALSAGDSFVTTRNPRTYVAINKDTSKICFVVVDGRQTISLGHTLFESATFLISHLKMSFALNLDGGGSSTMVVRGSVVNSPSDPGGERSVSTALMLVSTALPGPVASLNITEDKAIVFQGNTFRFHAEAADSLSNPVALPATVRWSADTAIGSIDSSGLFASKKVNDSGWVRLSIGSIKDSVRVSVHMIDELHVYPTSLIMVPGEQLYLTISGKDSRGNTAVLDNSLLSYSSNTAAGYASPNGMITATGFGSGAVTVMLDTLKQVLPFNASGNDTTIMIENFKSVFAWNWTLTNCDADNFTFGLNADSIVTSAPAFKVTYKFTPNTSPSTVNLAASIPISSRIDSLYLKVYGDGGGHTLKLFFADKDGELFVITSPTVVNWKNSWKNVSFRTVFATPVTSGTLDYPITLKQIQVVLGSANMVGGSAVGSIYLDDISVHYPNRAVTPQVLFDFNTNITGWLQPWGVGSGQTKGITTAANLVLSTEHPYEGTGCGKWTFTDDTTITTDWSIRIARNSPELGSMLRGSYIGAWVWANGETNLTMRTVIRDGNSGICEGPPFPVHHYGWKLIGTKLDAALFRTYLTAGVITDLNNRFNGFHVEGPNAALHAKTRVLYIDKMVTSALTVPTGFVDFKATWENPNVHMVWSVNSEISISRYVVERSIGGGAFMEIAAVKALGNTDTSYTYEFFDAPTLNVSISYRIHQWTNDGGQELSPVLSVKSDATGVSINPGIPVEFNLSQNFPNPFNPTTTLRYAVAASSLVDIKIFNILGQQVRTLVHANQDAGYYSVSFDGTPLASGVYIYRMQAGSFTAVKTMVLLK
ncbi:MAG: phosphodiester glycosidase family protein [Ignavibacteriales bacterium]|nr:phosphodiester glycosidase family protein [Ignavibacteriales bacterium]